MAGIQNAEGTATYAVTLQPGLNNLIVPRGIFINSPLGRALLNGTNNSGEQGWTNRIQNLSPGDWGYIWAFVPSNESITSADSTTLPSFGGIPGSPGSEAGVESRQVQAVFWINVSGSSDLSSLLSGLITNFTGEVTNDVINVTGAVTTLNLPQNVLSVLANATIFNNGTYFGPEYNSAQDQQYTSWFTNFLSEVWNTVTGIANALVTVFWTRPIAATAYIDGAIAGTLTTVSHGLAAAASWALQAVEAAMLWALNAAINWLVQHILKPAFQPIISIATTYTTNLAGDVSAHNASKFWQDFSWWPFWAVVLIGATAITIALGALDVFSLGTTFLALLIIGVVVSGIESLGSSEKAAFAGDGPFSGSIVTELSTLVAPTGGSVLALASVLSRGYFRQALHRWQ